MTSQCHSSVISCWLRDVPYQKPDWVGRTVNLLSDLQSSLFVSPILCTYYWILKKCYFSGIDSHSPFQDIPRPRTLAPCEDYCDVSLGFSFIFLHSKTYARVRFCSAASRDCVTDTCTMLLSATLRASFTPRVLRVVSGRFCCLIRLLSIVDIQL